MQTNIITLILTKQVQFLLDLLFVVSNFAYRYKRKGRSGKGYRRFITRQDLGSSINTESLSCRELSPFRSAHSTRQQASFVCVSPSTPHLITLLAVLSSQSSGFSSPVGEVAAPSLPQGALKKGVGVERRGSSAGLPQHPLLGSTWWPLREILANFPACHICWEPSLANVPAMLRAPALLLVFLALGECVAWMLLALFCIFWQ